MSPIRRLMPALFIALIIFSSRAAHAVTPSDYDRNEPQDLVAEHLYAQSALLVDEDSGEVLFSKNSRVRMYPASTTKIMTLLLALESGIALDAQVTIPAEAGQIPEGSSIIPVKPGDVMSYEDLLYGFMLSSGNDGANAIAMLAGGSIDAFVSRMNQRAAELGCEGTHFVNAHGYHDSNHYTTAQDLALISRTAMQNDDFRRIVAAPRWEMTIRRGGETGTQTIISRNSLLQSDDKYYYPSCTGIKTGHHNKAGWCFVGSAERDGMRVICVVLNCEQEFDKWYDAAKLFEYGFTRYEGISVGSLLERSLDRFASVRIDHADADDPNGGNLLMQLTEVEGGDQTIRVVAGSGAALDRAAERTVQALQIEWQRPLEAPVEAGERMGSLALRLDGFEPVTATLSASRSISAQPTEAPRPPTLAPDDANADIDRGAPTRGHPAVPLVLALLLVLLALTCALVALKLRAVRTRRRRARRRRRMG